MDEKLFKILKKVYYKKDYTKDENGYKIHIETGDTFDTETKTYHYSTEKLSPKEFSYLQESGYVIHDGEVISVKSVR